MGSADAPDSASCLCGTPAGPPLAVAAVAVGAAAGSVARAAICGPGRGTKRHLLQCHSLRKIIQ